MYHHIGGSITKHTEREMWTCFDYCCFVNYLLLPAYRWILMKLKRFNELKASLQFCSFYFHGGYNRPTNILVFFPRSSWSVLWSELSQTDLHFAQGIRGLGWLRGGMSTPTFSFFAEYRLVTTGCWRFSYIHKKNFVYISTLLEKGFQTLLFVPTPKN